MDLKYLSIEDYIMKNIHLKHKVSFGKWSKTFYVRSKTFHQLILIGVYGTLWNGLSLSDLLVYLHPPALLYVP